MYIITGAPNSGVTALRGSTLCCGNTEMTLQSKATTAPITIVTGISVRWSAVRIISRAMWGTARPMNATGPQYAVLIPVSSPVESKQ